ncbi:hypothetical protein [Polynucleobacter necessarius]|uniref:hypothetical protein n=1 Tax=Polynucleobacter necessarius TaxID=576610 RepID=UPI0013B06A0A|nr:hypothetical protein [Polynucleobacter necessarius]
MSFQDSVRRKNRRRFAHHLDDLGHLPDFEDILGKLNVALEATFVANKATLMESKLG